MPYTKTDYPEALKGLPKHAIDIWVSAFNSAFKQYNGDEGKSAATAWAAVKNKYKKVNDQWVAKEAVHPHGEHICVCPECNKEVTVKEDIKCNTQECPECNTQMRAKDIGERRESMLSDKNKSKLLQSALMSEYKIGQSVPIPKNLTIDEVFGDKVVYDVDGQLYESDYEIGEDGKAVFGDPKKVVSTKVFKAMEALSMENKRTMLDAALVAHLRLTGDEYVYVEDMTETEVIYNQDRQSYKAGYKIAKDGTVTIGEPKKVARQVTYKSMESLRTTYSEILQEAGRRNASLDSSRLKKIVELCQELLSSEEPDEKELKKATKEAVTTLKWLTDQAVMKDEDGESYPVEAYAYASDRETPETWKLRLWESREKKITKTQLGRASASLSPGGFKGNKVFIPGAEVSGVKRKIRTEYRKLGVETDDMPRWVQESLTRELIKGFTPLTEAKLDKGRATVIIIKAGFNATKDRYYPAEMLKRDYKVFEGMKMYADHPTEKEDQERPERSIKDWVATLSDVTCDENGDVTGVADVIESWLQKKLASLRERKMLSEMGISINAVGSASKATIEGTETMVIEKLVACRSVDFVTEPGAGGEVTLYESERNDIDLVELKTLKEHRPDLVKLIEANVRATITQEVKQKVELEEQVKEKDGQIETLTKERDELKEAAEKAVKEKAIAEAQAVIKEAVEKAELPDAAKERILERFKDSESAEGIEEAITTEKDYIAKLSESSKVKGLGPTKVSTEKDHEALKESFKKMNPEWTDEQVEIAVSGR